MLWSASWLVQLLDFDVAPQHALCPEHSVAVMWLRAATALACKLWTIAIVYQQAIQVAYVWHIGC